ncbi:MAG: transposase, family [Frankiales bacterium]|jgi:IS30 family transposase|nr:transposase, family [Frankiales bacterium]
MVGVGRPGSEPLREQRELFAQLIAQGVDNSEACRRVGVNRRTGTRWRFGRTIPSSSGLLLHYPAVITTRLPVISARYVSEEERVVLADLACTNATVTAIAAEMGRSTSTISRELRRNASGAYGAHEAHRLAAERRRRTRPRRVALDVELRQFVQHRLDRGWSPEQIGRVLPEAFPDEPSRRLAHESIYQALYSRERCSSANYGRGGWRRRARRRPDARGAGGLATPMVMIDQRAESVRDRVEVGHWEGDLIMGVRNRSAIGTLVEGTTRNVILVHLGQVRTALAVRDALIAMFSALPPGLRRSLTWDQGKEMNAHADLSRVVGMPVYFCHRSSPWERGSNGNMNGLLRDYFPKGTDLRAHTAEYLAVVAAEMNERPRGILGWSNPAAQFATCLPSGAAAATPRHRRGPRPG